MRAALIGLALACMAGCSVNSSPAPAQEVAPTDAVTGTLTLDWTLGNAKDPARCADEGVDQIVITVTDDGGGNVGTFHQDCEAFATTITLDVGHYAASAVMSDSAGHVITTAVDIDPFTIHGDDTIDIPIDFPQSSFF